uniref:SHSP domain-containing protein n=1 Tax=Kalanchoe fedtschenkoi TaxID=63787 RepID=A0A7N0TQ45_KALFE
MNIRQRLNPTSNVPARATGRPVYIDFTPRHDWRSDEEGSAVLVLALPGFTREQIKVTAEPSGNIRIRGLRHVVGRNWSRFNSEFRVPEGCIMTGIRAKFEPGNLHITIPNKNPKRNEKPKEDHQPIVTPEPPQPLSSPTKPSQPQLAQPPSSGPPPLEQLQPQNLPSPAPPKQSETPPSPPPPPPPSQLKQQERQPPTHPENALPQKMTAADAPPFESEKMPRKSQHDEATPERRSSSDDQEEEWEDPESRLAERIQKGSSDKISKEASAVVGTGEEVRKEELDKRGWETEARQVSSSELLKLEAYMKMAKGKVREERQTLVNMAAAALVIAGLGIYICCHIGGKING